MHRKWNCDWSSDVCSSDLGPDIPPGILKDVVGLVRALPFKGEGVWSLAVCRAHIDFRFAVFVEIRHGDCMDAVSGFAGNLADLAQAIVVALENLDRIGVGKNDLVLAVAVKIGHLHELE